MGNSRRAEVNNQVYDELGERWYTATNDPVALLRAEAAFRSPWVAHHTRTRHGTRARILDLGCGAGFLSNYLAREGFEVHGVDLSDTSLAVARKYDETRTVNYVHGDVTALPFTDGQFDVVCAMDLLEHVEDRERLFNEIRRVLRPGGTFFFYTFNRNWLSWLVVIKGVEWLLPTTPPRLHVLHLFIKPQELEGVCRQHDLRLKELHGVGPVFASRAFWLLLLRGVVSPDLDFAFRRSLSLGYIGFAQRNEPCHREGS